MAQAIKLIKGIGRTINNQESQGKFWKKVGF